MTSWCRPFPGRTENRSIGPVSLGAAMPEITHTAITHTAIGWTRSGAWPAGFRPMHHRIHVGTGEAAFQRLADGILTFGLHRRSSLRVHAGARAVAGGTVVLGFGLGALRMKIPCEVVWVEETHTTNDNDGGPRRAGFGYGTLPGHPESGEESFTAILDTDGSVFFELHAYSRHANWFYRLGAPAARFCQELVTRRYLAAARQLAATNG